MTISLKTKFVVVCFILVLLAIASLSITYYTLAIQEKQRESRQHIHIAFDILFDDFTQQASFYKKKLQDFIASTPKLEMSASLYQEDAEKLRSPFFLSNFLIPVTLDLGRFGHDISADRLALYGADRRLLAFYQFMNDTMIQGIYVRSESNQDTYFAIQDAAQRITLLGANQTIPDVPLPDGIPNSYTTRIPETVMDYPYIEEGKFGIRVVMPLYDEDTLLGMLVSDVFYTQARVERYAGLSKTAIDLFVGDQHSVGTLPYQVSIPSNIKEQMVRCEEAMAQQGMIDVFPATIANHEYYQGQCKFEDIQGKIGVIVINLSQDIEKQDIRKILTAVLVVSGITLCMTLIMSLFIGRKPIRAIQHLADVLRSVSTGDLQQTVNVIHHDEIGMLGATVNQMIRQLRQMVGQVQQSGVQVNASTGQLSATMQQQEVMMDNQVALANRVVKAIQDISNVVTDLVQTVQQVTSLSQETTHYASSSQSDLLRMEEAMRHMEGASTNISGKLQAINEKADNITSVVTTINKVAEQTNLLSLNASIEAEKAGEYGRGFTVVAREIRRLADQTAVATLDIGRMVEEMQAAIAAGVMEMDKFIHEVQQSAEDVGKISMQLSLIIDQVQALAPNFENVNQAMKHQSDSAQKINTAMVDLSERMNQMEDSLHETYSAIEQLNAVARALQDEVLRFKVE